MFEVRSEVFAQRLFRRGAVGSDAPGVEVKREPGYSDFIQVVNEHGDALGVEFGRDFSGVFDTDLVELAAASGCGTFSAEHGTDVEHAVLHAVECVGSGEGAHDAGGSLGAEGEAASAAILKRVHFLFDDFRFVAEPALENLGIFEDRGSELSVPVKGEDLFRGVFEEAPGGCLFGCNIAGSRRRC